MTALGAPRAVRRPAPRARPAARRPRRPGAGASTPGRTRSTSTVGGWCVGVVGPGAAPGAVRARGSDSGRSAHRRRAPRRGVPWGGKLHVGRSSAVDRPVGGSVRTASRRRSDPRDGPGHRCRPPPGHGGRVRARHPHLPAVASTPTPPRGCSAAASGLTPLGDDVLAAGSRCTGPPVSRPPRSTTVVAPGPRPHHPALRDAARLRPARRGAPRVRARWVPAPSAPPPSPAPPRPCAPSARTSGAGLLAGARLALDELAATLAAPARRRMNDHVELRPGAYADSVALLQVSRDVQGAAGRRRPPRWRWRPRSTSRCSAGWASTSPAADPNDMVVALRLDDDGDLDGGARGRRDRR